MYHCASPSLKLYSLYHLAGFSEVRILGFICKWLNESLCIYSILAYY